MKHKRIGSSELDRLRLRCIQWEAARDMVRRAVQRGWMAYPLNTRLKEDGRPRVRFC